MDDVEVMTPATLLSLPYEIQQKIAMDLDTESALNLCLGASALNSAICGDDNFWRAKYIKDFGPEKSLKSQSWFKNYKSHATVIASLRVYHDRHDEIFGEIKLFITDALTDRVVKTASVKVESYNLEDLLEQVDDDDDYVNFDMEGLHIERDRDDENLLKLGGRTIIYIDRALFGKLLREFMTMLKNRELGTVEITAGMGVRKTITGRS